MEPLHIGELARRGAKIVVSSVIAGHELELIVRRAARMQVQHITSVRRASIVFPEFENQTRPVWLRAFAFGPRRDGERSRFDRSIALDPYPVRTVEMERVSAGRQRRGNLSAERSVGGYRSDRPVARGIAGLRACALLESPA